MNCVIEVFGRMEGGFIKALVFLEEVRIDFDK